MKIIKRLPDNLIDIDGKKIDSNDEELLIGHLRSKIETAFATQNSHAAFYIFERTVIEDAEAGSGSNPDGWENMVLRQIDEFRKGENLQFARFKLPADYADLIEKNKKLLGIMDRQQFGVLGDVTLLLKRKVKK